MRDRPESAPAPHACALVEVDSQRWSHSWSARRTASPAAMIWTAAALAGIGSMAGRYGFSCCCQTAARGSCMVRAAPVRAQTRTSIYPPSSNYFCRPPQHHYRGARPAGDRSYRSISIERARGAHSSGRGEIMGGWESFLKHLEVDLLRIIYFSPLLIFLPLILSSEMDCPANFGPSRTCTKYDTVIYQYIVVISKPTAVLSSRSRYTQK